MGILIGLAGPAGSGKDTVAEMMGLKRYAFADAVRDVALAINPVIHTNWQTDYEHDYPLLRKARLKDYVDAHGWDWSKRNVPEIRRLLQAIGTEAGRLVMGKNVWVDIVFKKWADDGFPHGVVTDMRFENEFVALSGNGYPTVAIERPNNPDAITTNHVSETRSFTCDYTLVNDGTLDDLRVKVEQLMECIRADISG